MSTHSGCTCQTAAPLSPEVINQVDAIIARHKDQAGALMRSCKKSRRQWDICRRRCKSASPPASISRGVSLWGDELLLHVHLEAQRQIRYPHVRIPLAMSPAPKICCTPYKRSWVSAWGKPPATVSLL